MRGFWLGLVLFPSACMAQVTASLTYSSEDSYVKVVIRDRRLSFTYNARNSMDRPGKRNMAQRPHYTNKDLATERADLTQADVDAFAKVVRSSGFMKLANSRPPQTRYYPTSLAITLGSTSHTVVHCVGKPPKAFAAVQAEIERLVRSHFKRKLLG